MEMSESDRQRILRYSTYWQYYLGRQWAWKREEGEPQMTFNYSRAFVDKNISFLFGKGFGFEMELDQQREVMEPIVKEIWEDNAKKLWGIECNQMGAVSGDIFVKVGWEEPSEFNDLTEGRVRLIILDSAHCFPEWHPHAKDVLTSFRISYMYEVQTVRGQRTRKKYTEIITRDRFIIIDGDQRYEWPNSLGWIPIVHIKNRTVSNSTYGLSDLNDFTGLNREFNEKATNISDIINYHEAPITIVYGAKATSLEKGANKLWSGLPEKARVENLGLQSDLRASVEYLSLLKEAMFELSNVPEASLGKQQAVSNTSGVALHIQYQPLMELRSAKMLTYGPGIEKVTRMALRIYEMKKMRDFAVETGMKDPYKVNCIFPDPLPKDRLILLQEIQQRMQMPYPLITPPMALAMLGEDDVKGVLAHVEQWRPYMMADGSAPPTTIAQSPEDDAKKKAMANATAPPTGMSTATTIPTNAGGFMQKSMKPSGAVQSEMYSILRSGPGAG